MAGGSSVLVLWGLGWLPRGLPGLLALLLYRLLLSSGWFLAGGWEPSFKRLVSGVTPKPALEDEEAFLFSGSSVAAFKFPRELASREFMEKLLTWAPEDKEPLFTLLAVAEGDNAVFEVFRVDADICREELNLKSWDTALGCPFTSSNL